MVKALRGKVLPSACPNPASGKRGPNRSNAPSVVDSEGLAEAAAFGDTLVVVGKRFRDFDGGPEMIVVPAGTFLMGSTKSESDSDHERPQHRVSIARPFAVGIGPVTRGEFAAFVKATKPTL